MPVFGNNPQSPLSTENPNEPKKKKTGTGFTNIQKFLGASSGQKLGSQIAGGLKGQTSAFKEQLGQEQSQFGQELGQAQSAFDPNKRQQIFQQAGSTAPSEEDIKAFETYRSGKLGKEELGQGFKGYGNLQQQAQDISQQASDVGSLGGRYNLLQRYASGGKQYTPGLKRLDAMLLGQGGAKELQQARTGSMGIGQQLQKAQEGAQAQYGVAAGKAKQFGEETGKMLEGGMSDIEKSINMTGQRQAIDQSRLEKEQQLENLVATGLIDPTTASQIGLSEGQYLYGLSPIELKNALNLDQSKLQFASQFANKEQDARMRALAKLAGKDISGFGKEGTAGEAQTALNLNKDYITKKLAEKQAEYNTARNQEQITGIDKLHLGEMKAGAGYTGDNISGQDTVSNIASNYGQNLDDITNILNSSKINPEFAKQYSEYIQGKGEGLDYKPVINSKIQELSQFVQNQGGAQQDPFTGKITYSTPEAEQAARQMVQLQRMLYGTDSMRMAGKNLSDWESARKGKSVSFGGTKTGSSTPSYGK